MDDEALPGTLVKIVMFDTNNQSSAAGGACCGKYRVTGAGGTGVEILWYDRVCGTKFQKKIQSSLSEQL